MSTPQATVTIVLGPNSMNADSEKRSSLQTYTSTSSNTVVMITELTSEKGVLL